jgi:glutaconate CoA-transferase, subunit B
LVTDLCVFKLEPEGAMVESIHPWVTKEEVQEATGWTVKFPDEIATSIPPTQKELDLLDEVDPNNLRAIEFFSNADRQEQAMLTWHRESAAS